ncbi:abnormal spindle-like microcephaly-associated protein homolog [Rhopalosiphum padi]|uniref:abnormal spindle-like microcephaly-associated protein homolog n=1 Tax=Rhopalosiphum padi TaxID=40932 RepID=UPI00298DEB58|nr:abnormal spindle-like microcephaly-associated protein homolog [Rhopalosiphum padi]
MAKFVVEFSPPEKIKSEPYDVTDSIVNYRMVLAPFQKQTQVEFNNIKLKEIAVRFLTVVNPLDKHGQFVLPLPSDGVYFDVYKFTLEPNSQRELSITWQPSQYGNMRKLIKIEQVDNNKKYDFVILGNCNSPSYKKFKGATSTTSKTKISNLTKKQLKREQEKVLPKKTNHISSKTERIILVKNPVNIPEPISEEIPPIRRQTYLVGEKENLPVSKKNVLCRDTILTSPERSIKRPDQKRQDHVFNNHFNLKNLNNSSSPMSDDSLEKPLNKIFINNSQLNDFYLTPLKSTENLLSPFSVKKQINNFDVTDGPLVTTLSNSFVSKPLDGFTSDLIDTPENQKSSNVCVNLWNKFLKSPEDELTNGGTNVWSHTVNSRPSTSPSDVESNDFIQKCEMSPTHNIHQHTMITWGGTKSKRPSFSIKNSLYYKCSPKTSMTSKNKVKQCSTNPRTTRLKTPKLDKYDEYLKCLANPQLLYHNNAEDPFLKMSEYYETEWLDRQESDMIRWLNAMLTPTEKLVDEEQSNELEEAAMAWVEASKTCHKNKPMQFATQKDLFVAQIYRQSPQQWSALRKATTNLITSSSVTSVLSKLTVSIEKDLITLRDDRQIHLDLSLKKKIIDLLKCYNPLWFRIGLEAIYGQIVHVKPGSNDLDGIGWFVRKNLFNNDYVKQKFIKTTVLQMNLPSYNTAMKKFILRKMFMLIYFLDRAKEQQLIRHNPCLFKTNSPYKSSYDLMMGFCADMVTAHGDIVRRLRSIGYNLAHKQTHLDEVNYAVKSLNDLRDGTRITRVVEILFKGNPLSQKLRLPAISKLQKIHNVNLAFTRISEHISIEGNITTRDIVNGHREKMLSLFWQIIYKYLTPRYNNAATKIQNWWRNSSLKLVISKRIRAKTIAKRHIAATDIQARVRGHLIRKKWPQLRAELVKNRDVLHTASTTIKRYLKDKLKLLTDDRKRFIILRRTVVFVQKKYRNKMAMVKERQKYLKFKQSAIVIQKAFRGFMLRKNWPEIKNNLIAEKTKRIAAVDTIKRFLRKNLSLTQDRLAYLKLKRTVLYAESRYVANKTTKLQMKRYAALKSAAVCVQRRFRANAAMKRERENYLKAKRSALTVQKVFRGFAARRRWPDVRYRLVSENERRTAAVNTIKRALRKNLPPTRDRLTFLTLKRAVLYTESRYVANKSTKSQTERYAALKNAAVFVQRRFRANAAATRDRQRYLNARRSAVLIQKTFRCFVAKKRWPATRDRLRSEMERRVAAADTVKRALRRNLPATRERVEFAGLRSAALFVQRTWRAKNLMRVQREWYTTSQYATVYVQRTFRAKVAMRSGRREYLKVKRSAVIIQKVYRAYVARRVWPDVRDRLVADRAERARAADVIKRALRRRLPVVPDRLHYERLRRSAVAVQRRYRANVAMRTQREAYRSLRRSVLAVQRRFRANRDARRDRSQYARLRSAAVGLQAAARGHLFRRHRWPTLMAELTSRRLLMTRCADTVKRALMRRLADGDRRRFLELRRAAIVVQRRFRTRRQAREYAKLRDAAITVQQRFRANRAARRHRTEYLRVRAAAVLLQACVRGRRARVRWPVVKRDLQAHQNRLVASSNTVKKFLRLCLPATDERCEYLRLRRAAVAVQTRYRAVVAGRHDRAEYLRLRRCAIVLQRWYRDCRALRSVVLLQAYIRGCLIRRRWPELKHRLEAERKLEADSKQEKYKAATKIQAAVRGFLTRKRFPKLRDELITQKRACAITLIQALWRGYCVRKKYQCRRDTVRMPRRSAQTLGRRHNDVVDILNKQKKNEYSYKELATVFWNLDTCTSLSKELCMKTADGAIVDYIFHFLQYSNQSQPSTEAREPAIRVLINLLRYHETTWIIWTRTVNADMVKELIKMMKMSCGKFGSANKLFCLIATFIWIALQDPEKKRYFKSNPTGDFKYMMDSLNRRYKTHKIDKKLMVLPSTRPTWYIGSKCQKCFESDLFATTQVCKMLNIIK